MAKGALTSVTCCLVRAGPSCSNRRLNLGLIFLGGMASRSSLLGGVMVSGVVVVVVSGDCVSMDLEANKLNGKV